MHDLDNFDFDVNISDEEEEEEDDDDDDDRDNSSPVALARRLSIISDGGDEGEVWNPSKSDAPTLPRTAKQRWRKILAVVKAAGAFKMALRDKRRHRTAVLTAAVSTVVAGCTCCVPFEILNKADRGCSDLILFFQYVYATCEVLATCDVRAFLFKRKMPLWCHLSTLAFEGARNSLYNMAINRALPMPAYLVLKNSGLVVSMFLGVTVQGRRYKPVQIAGVFAITIGVIAACLACRPALKAGAASSPGPELDAGTFAWATMLMIAGVLVTAFMNVVQEHGFTKHGRHYQETVFYANALGLPLFLFNANGMMSHVRTWNAAWEPLPLPAPLDVHVPYLWLLLLVNIASQSVMKMSCLKLTGLAGSVPNVVTVTVFRFVSLVLSACVMNSPPFPPAMFWVGGVLVLSGTLGYALAGAPPKKKRKSSKKTN